MVFVSVYTRPKAPTHGVDKFKLQKLLNLNTNLYLFHIFLIPPKWLILSKQA